MTRRRAAPGARGRGYSEIRAATDGYGRRLTRFAEGPTILNALLNEAHGLTEHGLFSRERVDVRRRGRHDGRSRHRPATRPGRAAGADVIPAGELDTWSQERWSGRLA